MVGQGTTQATPLCVQLCVHSRRPPGQPICSAAPGGACGPTVAAAAGAPGCCCCQAGGEDGASLRAPLGPGRWDTAGVASCCVCRRDSPGLRWTTGVAGCGTRCGRVMAAGAALLARRTAGPGPAAAAVLAGGREGGGGAGGFRTSGKTVPAAAAGVAVADVTVLHRYCHHGML